MFSGIVESVGEIGRVQSSSDGLRICIVSDLVRTDSVKPGDSIAVSGVCLTVVLSEEGRFCADVSNETIRCTNFGNYAVGTFVNLETSLTSSKLLSGHLVYGHVDGVAKCSQIKQDGNSSRIEFEIEPELGKFLAEKGSVAVDGVSMTINKVIDSDSVTVFSVNVIPHTSQFTTLGKLKISDNVHIEVDMLARYVARIIETQSRRNEHN